MCVILTGKGAGFLEPSWAAWEPPDLPVCVCVGGASQNMGVGPQSGQLGFQGKEGTERC